MTFKIESNELLKLLNLAYAVIPSNPVMTILENFLFRVERNRLTVTASGVELTLTSSVAIQSSDEGAIAMPARLLLDTVKALPSQSLTFEIDDHESITIKSHNGVYKLVGLPASDFPKAAELNNASKLNLDAQKLQRGINKTIIAVSNDDLRPAMTGVFFDFEGGKLNMVATDAHKLVKFGIDGVEESISGNFIVPRKTLPVLKNAIANSDFVEVEFTRENAIFRVENLELQTLLVKANYPDYEMVIPRENPNRFVVDRGDMHGSLRRIALYSNKTTHQVAVTMSSQNLSLVTRDLDFQNEASEQLNCSYNGDSDLTVGFNAKFLLELLGALESDEVQFEMSTPNRAVILRPLVESEEGEETLMLVMPVVVNYSA